MPHVAYLELATDSAFTNPIRVPQRFIVGIVVNVCGASQQAEVLFNGYPYGDGSSSPATGLAFNGVVSTQNTNAGAYGTCGYWFRHGASVTTGSTWGGSSSAAQEFARVLSSQFGVYVGLTGSAQVGEGFTDWLAEDGSLASVGAQAAIAAVNGKFRYWWNNWVNGTKDTNFVPATAVAGFQIKMPTAYPACAFYGCNFGMDGVITNGSAESPAYSPGYGRMQALIIAATASNPMMISFDDYHCNGQVSGHWTMASRVQWARVNGRNVADWELSAFGGRQTPNLGPVLASAGTFSGRTITIPFTHHGGATLSALTVTENNGGISGTDFAYANDATAAEIASLFSVWGPGGYYGYGGKSIAITGAVINSSSITLTLAGSTGVVYTDSATDTLPSSLTVQFVADTNLCCAGPTWGGGRAIVLVDDQVDSGNGIPFGRHMKQALDIVVPTAAPTLPSFTITNWGS